MLTAVGAQNTMNRRRWHELHGSEASVRSVIKIFKIARAK
jgi:hypothetical protein